MQKILKSKSEKCSKNALLKGEHNMEKLIKIIEDYVEFDGEITRSLSFKNDLGLSSFDTVCMIEELKSEFKKDVTPNDFIKYKTVGEMSDYLSC